MISVQVFTFNAYQENTYLLYDKSTLEAVLIDPGMYDREEQNSFVKFVSEHKLKLIALLNTHCHIDHVFGNHFICDMYGLLPQFHEGELATLAAVVSYAPQMGMKYEVSPLPSQFLKEKDSISLGNNQLEVRLVPGHSPAHLCFYSASDQFLIAGDTLFYKSIGRTDLPGGDFDQLKKSIETQLLTLPDACKIYPGHRRCTSIAFEKQHNPFLTQKINSSS